MLHKTFVICWKDSSTAKMVMKIFVLLVVFELLFYPNNSACILKKVSSKCERVFITSICIKKLQFMFCIGVYWGQGNPNQRVNPFLWETRLAEFPLEGWSRGWDVSVDTEHQWSIVFLTYHNRIVLQMAPLCLYMIISEINERRNYFSKTNIFSTKMFLLF